MPELNEWDNFFVIVGSAAGALVGLQFVVLTLIAERPPVNAADAGAAFATPTIVHFSVVLLLSAVLCAPWHSVTPIAMLCGIFSLIGMIYSLIVARRMRLQVVYKPGFEDWFFHAVLPLATYAGLGLSAVVARAHMRHALFGVGAALLLLLVIGIHNAWDAVTYQVLVNKRPTEG